EVHLHVPDIFANLDQELPFLSGNHVVDRDMDGSSRFQGLRNQVELHQVRGNISGKWRERWEFAGRLVIAEQLESSVDIKVAVALVEAGGLVAEQVRIRAQHDRVANLGGVGSRHRDVEQRRRACDRRIFY